MRLSCFFSISLRSITETVGFFLLFFSFFFCLRGPCDNGGMIEHFFGALSVLAYLSPFFLLFSPLQAYRIYLASKQRVFILF